MESKEETEVFYDCPEMCSFDDYDQNWAKEKASVIWLLSKAFGGTIPSDLKEPFYRDKDNVRRLKPKIVHSLATAELYCLALVNIYADPNYHNLDHQGIIQALMRKGICLVESRDSPLTETVLVQTAPIRMHAHMAVIDGMMSLYIKEVLIPEKIVDAVREFSNVDVNSEMPSNPEEAAVLWINKCCITLEQEIKSGYAAEEESRLPKIPVLQEISDISDGCSLAAVLSYYCPNYIRWQDICWNDPMSLGDSIYNLQLVKKFCSDYLPHDINFLTLEDLLYLHPSIKDNVLVFVADLLYMFVIWRVSCVTRCRKSLPLESSQIPLESSKSLSNFPTPKTPVPCSPIPNLRSDSYGGSTTSLPDIRPGSRSRIYGSKEKLSDRMLTPKKLSYPNDETISNQSQKTTSSNLVNGWKVNSSSNLASSDTIASSPRHSVPCLSRLNTEDENQESTSSNTSQPSTNTQNHQSFIKQSPQAKTNSDQSQNEHATRLQNVQKEPASYGLRNFTDGPLQGFRSSGDGSPINSGRGLFKGRKSLEDYYNQLAKNDGPLRSVSASNIIDSKSKKKFNHDKYSPRSRGDESVPESASSHSSGICISDLDHKNLFSTTSFAELSRLRDASSNSINIVYMQHDKDTPEHEKTSLKSTFLQRNKKAQAEGKKTTFAALPNTTTWQQQHAATTNSPQTDSGHETPTESNDNLLNAQLCNVRMKLEDKKRKIELKKKRMELLWKKQRQKLGKAAFLQAVSKGGGSDAGTPDSGTEKDVTEAELPPAQQQAMPPPHSSPSLVKRMSIQDIAEDLDIVQKKWLAQNEAADKSKQDSITDLSLEVGDGDNDASNIDFQTSIANLNMSLTDLQADISRISLQQEQVESLMKDSVDDASHFFLHSRTPNELESKSLPSQSPFNWDGSYLQQCNQLYDKSNNAALSPQHTHKTNIKSVLDVHIPFSSLPVNCTEQPKEELYSKVIKPENRQKAHYLNTRAVTASPSKVSPPKAIGTSAPKETIYDICKQENEYNLSPKHDFLPQMPDKNVHKITLKKGKEMEQGFTINFEKEPKKPKPKLLRNGKMESAKNVQKVEAVVVPKASVNDGRTAKNEDDTSSFGFVIGADLVHPDPETETEMARKKEMIMHMSIQRKAAYERKRAEKEREYAKIKEEERRKQEYHERRREEERRRREFILEQYRQRKIQEEIEKEGGISHLGGKDSGKSSIRPRMRREAKPRPRSAYIPTNTDPASFSSMDYSAANRRSSQLIYCGREVNDFDLDSLNSASTTASSQDMNRSPNGVSHQLALPPRGGVGLQVPDGPSSDGASDTASNGSAAADYNGPKLFVKPAAKSNRGIITNAINTVLAGAVNADMKMKVLEEINRSESKHFLILFRDAGCQFRALYSYNPDREEVTKLYGIGPKNVMDKMMDRFYKYNSGGKCFSEIQTKHLTVTIDAFTIPNSLWAGKKNIVPRKEFF